MTYRNPLDALAAREAALAKEVAEKRKERDQVAAELAAAKEREAAAQRAAAGGARTRMWFPIASVLVIALVVAGGAGFVLFARHAVDAQVKAPRIYTCDELGPEHAKADADTLRNYTAALSAKGLHEIELGSDQIGLGGRAESPDELDKVFGRPLKTGAVISYTNADGKQLSAYVGEALRFDYGPSDMYFASDGHGNIWRVVRKPRVVPLRTVQSEGCQWGCWGLPPPGAAPPQHYHRALWLLPDGATFAGEVTIEYVAPALDEHPTNNCGLPG